MEDKGEGPLFFLLGAGASVDSGMKTYRSNNNDNNEDLLIPNDREALLYTYYDESNPPMTIDAFESDQGMERMWNHVEELRTDKDNSWIGPTYMKLQKICQNTTKEVLIVTQNVDGIIRKLSFGKNVTIIELHGHLCSATCVNCKKVWSMPIFQQPIEQETPRGKRIMEERRRRSDSFSEEWKPEKIDKLLTHHCGDCGNWLRPDVVLIGESVNPKYGFEIFSWIKQKRPTRCYVVGTTLQFSYLRNMIMTCRKRQAKIVHVNTDPEYQWHCMKEKTYAFDGRAMTKFVRRKKNDELKKEL